jgi:hypothetical protein
MACLPSLFLPAFSIGFLFFLTKYRLTVGYREKQSAHVELKFQTCDFHGGNRKEIYLLFCKIILR